MLLQRKLTLHASDDGTIIRPFVCLNKRLHSAISPVIKCSGGIRHLALVISKKKNLSLHWAPKDFVLRAIFNSIADVNQDLDVFQELLEDRQSKAPRNAFTAQLRIEQAIEFCKKGDEADEGTLMEAFADLFIAISVYLAQ